MVEAVAPVAFNETEGIQEKGYMNFTRSDGTKQQTINCSPIYTFSGDKSPGDVNGQGVGGTWYAVAPNGKLVGALAAVEVASQGRSRSCPIAHDRWSAPSAPHGGGGPLCFAFRRSLVLVRPPLPVRRLSPPRGPLGTLRNSPERAGHHK